MHFEKSILIKSIPDKANPSIIIYHNVLLLDIISEEKWGSSLAATKMLPKSPILYSYHDYITAWFRFMLHQDDNMIHSWFVNFDKNFNAHLPLWFSHWWTQFGPVTEIFLRPLIGSFKYFATVFIVDSHGAKFPASLYFVKKYNAPWILKWKYVKEGDVLTRHWYVKWWDKFSHTQNVIDNVTWEFLVANEISYAKAQSQCKQLYLSSQQMHLLPHPLLSLLNLPLRPKRRSLILMVSAKWPSLPF